MDSETLGLAVALFLTAVVTWKTTRESMPDSVNGFIDVLAAIVATAAALTAIAAVILLAVITFMAV